MSFFAAWKASCFTALRYFAARVCFLRHLQAASHEEAWCWSCQHEAWSVTTASLKACHVPPPWGPAAPPHGLLFSILSLLSLLPGVWQVPMAKHFRRCLFAPVFQHPSCCITTVCGRSACCCWKLSKSDCSVSAGFLPRRRISVNSSENTFWSAGYKLVVFVQETGQVRSCLSARVVQEDVEDCLEVSAAKHATDWSVLICSVLEPVSESGLWANSEYPEPQTRETLSFSDSQIEVT